MTWFEVVSIHNLLFAYLKNPKNMDQYGLVQIKLWKCLRLGMDLWLRNYTLLIKLELNEKKRKVEINWWYNFVGNKAGLLMAFPNCRLHLVWLFSYHSSLDFVSFVSRTEIHDRLCRTLTDWWQNYWCMIPCQKL